MNLKTKVVLKKKADQFLTGEDTQCSFFLPVNVKVLMTDTDD